MSNPGEFAFITSTPSGVYAISNQIPRQTIYLESFRIEVDDAATALALKALRFEFPWFAGLNLIDDQISKTSYVIPLDNAAVSRSVGMKQPIVLSHTIHDRFEYKITDLDGNVPTGLVHVILKFSFGNIYTS